MKTLQRFSLILLALLSTKSYSQSISAPTLSLASPYCPGSSFTVTFTATGSFASNNVFRTQLSTAAGSFGTVTVIGSLTQRNPGTYNITATIPSNTAAGTGYRIRVVSTNPVINGTDNGTNLTILASGNCGANWSISGNGGINTFNNFIGTINDAPLVFKVKNQKSGIIDSALQNTALGYLSLSSNTTGYRNIAAGTGALKLNTTGYNNVAIGFAAMYNNTVGYDNIAIGDSSGGYAKYDYFPDNSNPPIPYGNTSVGAKSMKEGSYSLRNTALGYKALYATINRSADNVAVGSESLLSNKRGARNVAVGSRALYNNSEISYIPAYGAEDPGDGNIAMGYEALFNNKIGDNNTAVGNRAMHSNTTLLNPNATSYGDEYIFGDENTAYGNSSLFNNTIGDSNTAIGSYSMLSSVTGMGNTTLGTFSDVGSEQIYAATAIGFRSKVNCNNCLVLGSVAQVNNARYNTRVGIGTIAPDSSAALEINSKNRGLLIPRMTQAEREAIIKPAEGLLVYQTNNTRGIWYYDGASWVNAFLGSPLQTAGTLQLNNNPAIISLDNTPATPLLGQNIPNPFKNTTLIPFRIPGNCTDATIVITSLSTGQIVKAIPVSCKETQLSIDASKLASGSYSYSLYIDGKAVLSKKMTLNR